MANTGFFIITDISGYTEFLTKSEIDHAQDAIQSLFDVQINSIKHPFVISGFRGDAILMYCQTPIMKRRKQFWNHLKNCILSLQTPCGKYNLIPPVPAAPAKT